MWRRRGQREGRAQGQEPERFSVLTLAHEAFERELERRSAKFVQVPEDETSNELVIAKIASNSSY